MMMMMMVVVVVVVAEMMMTVSVVVVVMIMMMMILMTTPHPPPSRPFSLTSDSELEYKVQKNPEKVRPTLPLHLRPKQSLCACAPQPIEEETATSKWSVNSRSQKYIHMTLTVA